MHQGLPEQDLMHHAVYFVTDTLVALSSHKINHIETPAHPHDKGRKNLDQPPIYHKSFLSNTHQWSDNYLTAVECLRNPHKIDLTLLEEYLQFRLDFQQDPNLLVNS